MSNEFYDGLSLDEIRTAKAGLILNAGKLEAAIRKRVKSEELPCTEMHRCEDLGLIVSVSYIPTGFNIKNPAIINDRGVRVEEEPSCDITIPVEPADDDPKVKRGRGRPKKK